jgi:hypothetical protein
MENVTPGVYNPTIDISFSGEGDIYPAAYN